MLVCRRWGTPIINRFGKAREVPKGVWVLGFVSLLMDVSSEMIHSLLPVFMVSALSASATTIGLVEGVAEATALIVKVFSGFFSDFLGRRKELTIFGYGLGAVSKPLFAIAHGVPGVLAARFLDRIGKGIRGSPRDALIADLTPEPLRGTAYGLRQSLDTAGAFLGPLVAIGLMLAWSGNFRKIFWCATIPGLMSVALLAIGVKEPASTKPSSFKQPIHWRMLSQLDVTYWRIVILGAVFTIARFSEAFLVLRARQYGLPDFLAPLVLVAMNIIYMFSAYPAGVLADRFDRRLLIAAGLIALISADLVLARSTGLVTVMIGIGFWGLHLGLTQGVFAAMIAACAPAHLRASAFGLFNLACGLAMLLASVLAGFLWDVFGAATTFYMGAAFAILALSLSSLKSSNLKTLMSWIYK